MDKVEIKNLHGNEIDLKDLFKILWNKKKIIIAVTAISAILSIAYSLSIQNIYTSKSLLLPSQPNDSLSSKISGLSSFTGFAGFSLPDEQVSKSQEGIERIKSFEFFSKFFLPNIKVEDLLASQKWDASNNKIFYDKKLFNASSGKWINNGNFVLIENKPSEQYAYKEYRRILSIIDDKKTSFVHISIEHKSPEIAKNWLDIIIYQINESMRDSDKEEAKKSIEYLNEAQKSINILSIKEVISLLLEKQIQTLMLTSSNDYYVFKVIDPPVIPESKSGPSRSVICILGTFFGFLFSLFLVFILNLREKISLAR